MELLYLWIEDYKNIKQQGFNFSPLYDFHFEPKFDKNDKEKKNVTGGTLIDKMKPTEKEIKEKFYKDFFKDDTTKNTDYGITNVTAIVGGNGAGKSSLITFLLELSMYKHIIIYKEPNGNIFYCSRELIINDPKINYLSYKGEGFIMIPLFINNSVFNFDNISIDSYINQSKSLIKHSDVRTYGVPEVLDLNKEIINDRSIFFLSNFKDEIQDYLSFIPNSIDFNISFDGFLKNKDENYKPDEREQKIIHINNELSYRDTKEYYERFIFTWALILNIEGTRISELKAINFNVIDIIYSEITEIESYKRIDSWIELSKKEIEEKFRDTEFQDISKLISKFYNIYPLLIYDKKLNNSFDKKIIYSIDNFLSKTSQISHFTKVLKKLKLNGYFKEVMFAYFKYRSLSSGEYHILDLLSVIYENNEKGSLIILDEPDSTLHPNWQKKLLQTLLRLIPKIFPKKKIQLILTSHSPFLVSDLPKENVIFLEKGADGKCIVAQPTAMKQTFGANIHTLLTNSFFMKDGLTGTFAQDKIDKVIDLLNQTEELKPHQVSFCEEMIKRIGEPIVKNTLQKLLDSKRLQKVDEHDDKIKQLEKELEQLRGLVNQKARKQ